MPKNVGLSILRRTPELIGSTFQLRPYGGRAFQCKIQAIDPPNRLEMEYFGGFIEGSGSWKIESCDTGTHVQYDLDVRASGLMVAIVGRLFPLARIHSNQMKQVLSRLEKELKSNYGAIS